MLQGIGIDLITIEQFKNLKNKKTFLKNFLNDHEISRAAILKNKNRYLAVLFALKEAVMKTFHIGLNTGSHWHDIKIHKDFKVNLVGIFKKINERRTQILVSKSSSKKYAVGLVLTQK